MLLFSLAPVSLRMNVSSGERKWRSDKYIIPCLKILSNKKDNTDFALHYLEVNV